MKHVVIIWRKESVIAIYNNYVNPKKCFSIRFCRLTKNNNNNKGQSIGAAQAAGKRERLFANHYRVAFFGTKVCCCVLSIIKLFICFA
jgi:hypothetical protein